MRFEKKDNQIIFTQVYGIVWVVGLFFIAIASIGIYTTFFGNNLQEVENWQLIIARFVCLSIIFAGFYLIYTHPKHSLSMDLSTNKIELKITGLFNNQSKKFKFAEVKDFSLETLKDDEDHDYYEILMNLSNGKSQRITKSFHKVKSEYLSIISSLNEPISENPYEILSN